MPFCPRCRAEYRPEFKRCAECDADLVDTLPEKEPAGGCLDGFTLVELAVFPNVSEAEMIQELLAGNGISTVLRGESDPIGVTSGAVSITLLADQKDFIRARQIYEDYFAGEVAIDEAQSADPL